MHYDGCNHLTFYEEYGKVSFSYKKFVSNEVYFEGSTRRAYFIERQVITIIHYEMITSNNREMVEEFIKNNWGSDIIVSRGIVHDAKLLEGFIANEDDKLCGLITYRIDKDECEIITLDSIKEGCGIGSTLIQRVIEVAIENNCIRTFLITTNDNIDGIKFYQKRRFDLVAIHRNAVREARKIKPQIPLYGFYDIEIKHEIEFELTLQR